LRPYSDAFKRKLVQRMLVPGGPTAAALSLEVGVHQTTLSLWRRQAATLGCVTQPPKPPRDSGPSHDPQRPEDRTPEEKLRLVLEAAALPPANLGEFLRRHGIHEADLASWREAALEGLGERHRTQPRGSAGTDHRRVRELERELRRKDKALAETAALLVLQKKVRAIWGDEDDDTKAGSDD
jgi:transposase